MSKDNIQSRSNAFWDSGKTTIVRCYIQTKGSVSVNVDHQRCETSIGAKNNMTEDIFCADPIADAIRTMSSVMH